MKSNKIIYWIFTVLLSAMMIIQAKGFILNSESLADLFNRLGYPSSIIIPLGVAKVFAVAAILIRRISILKKLAYFGLAADFVLALISHLVAGESWLGPVIALVLLSMSYVYERKAFS